MKNTIKYIFAGVLAGTFALTGCVKEKDLNIREGSGRLTINVDWSTYGPSHTAALTIYNEDGTVAAYADGIADQHQTTLPSGRYRLLVHNMAMTNASVRYTEDYHGAEVYAHLSGVRAPGTLITQPEAILASNHCDNETIITVSAGTENVYTTCPVALTKTVVMRVIITGASDINSVSGVLNGVSGSLCLSSGEANLSDDYSVEYEAVEDPDNAGEFLIKVNLLGLLAQRADGVTSIDVSLTDSNDITYEVSEDISSIVRSVMADNSGVIPLEIPLRINISFENIGLPEITVKPWDPGVDGEIEIVK